MNIRFLKHIVLYVKKRVTVYLHTKDQKEPGKSKIKLQLTPWLSRFLILIGDIQQSHRWPILIVETGLLPDKQQTLTKPIDVEVTTVSTSAVNNVLHRLSFSVGATSINNGLQNQGLYRPHYFMLIYNLKSLSHDLFTST